ncbi:hypothetical protein FB45DRAFT_872417 [Roridomyces roridus]|uniref:Uncharacterized protein n=1 Tax=Roridomyces roridus TaxID=1738132 RepID=A0AAD7BDT8_9AGAR|nr:hypothetical protein FB45DRAFT_872417 [Roridomyces roridus]
MERTEFADQQRGSPPEAPPINVGFNGLRYAPGLQFTLRYYIRMPPGYFVARPTFREVFPTKVDPAILCVDFGALKTRRVGARRSSYVRWLDALPGFTTGARWALLQASPFAQMFSKIISMTLLTFLVFGQGAVCAPQTSAISCPDRDMSAGTDSSECEPNLGVPDGAVSHTGPRPNGTGLLHLQLHPPVAWHIRTSRTL